MRNKKDRLLIINRIRQLAAKKKERRQGRKKKARRQNQVLLPPPRVPRKIRRYKSSNKYFLPKKESKPLTQIKSEFVKKYLPENLKYITETENSPFNLNSIRKEKYKTDGVIKIPVNFSVLDNPDESFPVLRQLISALLLEDNDKVVFDYEKCQNIELSTQILVDIVLIDYYKLRKICKSIERQKRDVFPIVGHINLINENLLKLIYSVGSPVNLGIKQIDFPDIVKCKLRIHNNRKEKDIEKLMAQKELDTTEMAEYIIECMRKVNRKLSHEKLDDLCTVIGEILINAEEHSTTQHRFSIGYFKEENESGNHFGLFRLVILNFGKTIYEKFKSVDCPNQEIVTQMNNLSVNFTKKSLFSSGEFEEESLWTLYALQEGVTSVLHESKKRGNGFIRFIESFYNIKDSNAVDNTTKMLLVSGRTRIIFDGKYSVENTIKTNGEQFKVMTFNDSKNIEDKPDKECVLHSKNYFPGTMISAKILLNDENFKQI